MNVRTLWNPRLKPASHKTPIRERGQMIYIVVLITLTSLGMLAMTLDIGRTFLQYHQLVASTDAAALAGGVALGAAESTSDTVQAAVAAYSSASGDKNTYTDLNYTGSGAVSFTKTLLCLQTLTNQGIPCQGSTNSNAVRVVETENFPTAFALAFGQPTVALTATATASVAGAGPYNIAIILDATLSQTSTDDDCGSGVTEMNCELRGVQTLLLNLQPCPKADGTCSVSNGVASDSIDRVSLFTFPAASVGTMNVNSTCTSPINSSAYPTNAQYGYYSTASQTPWSKIVTDVPYAFPTVGATSYVPATSPASSPTYQVTPWESDYKTAWGDTTLNTSAQITKALGGVSGCGGMLPGNDDGNIGTYYAGVLYAAQASLVAEQSNYPGSHNAIIILSDGDATAPQSNCYNGATAPANTCGVNVIGMPSPAGTKGTYPSYKQECAQAVTAAKYAAGQGTKVFSIAYGASTSSFANNPAGCATDTSTSPTYTPCSTMTAMASSSNYFYSDYSQSGSNSNCTTGTNGTDTSINDIFQYIIPQLGVARLIPNSTQ